MPTITTNDLEVVFPGSVKDDIIVEELKNGTEIIALKNVSNLETTVTGTAAFVGKGVSNSPVVLESTKKNTPKIVLQNAYFSLSEIKVSGKGSGEVKTNNGIFRNNTFTGGKKNDSVSFKGNSIVNNNKFNLGKGGDSITFSKATTFKGKTTINLVPGGKDFVKFGKNLKTQKGSVLIKNFERKDILKVGKKTVDYNDIKNGDQIPGIEIRLA